MGVFCSQLRAEEKLIFEALERRRVPYERTDVRRVAFDLAETRNRYSVVLLRCISHSQSLYVARILNQQGIKTVNSYQTIVACGDKLLTTAALAEQGIPTPRTVVAFTARAALQAIEDLGYPVVLKPLVGSWGRLLSKVNDRQAAEAILEHKEALGVNHGSVFYIQEYVDKPQRDIRVLVAGDEVVYAIYRRSEHWITNTGRGAEANPCPITPELAQLSLAAAQAVRGGLLAVDILEMPDGRLLVNEVNHTPEFHGALKATRMDIAGRMVDYVLSLVE
ncbi:MAG: lysine biosynthesis protein LysX [Anaerolineae bacterium]